MKKSILVFLVLVMLFSKAFPSLRRVQPLLNACTVIWIPLMAFSRMVEGMHFASDVTAGFVLALAIFALVSSERFRKWTAPLAKKL